MAGAANLSTVNIKGVYKAPEVIIGTENDDEIENYADGMVIEAIGGNDYVYNSGASSLLDGGDDNDTIENNGSNSTIIGGAGNDTIRNHGGSNIVIDTGEGNDTISNNNANNSTIIGGAGNDSISNYSSNVYIDGEDGNDTISNSYGSYSTIIGGAGDDSIYNYSSNVLIDSGDGNDLITGFDETSTLSISGDKYSKDTVGNDLIITVDDGSITLQGAATLATVHVGFYRAPEVIIGTEGDDNITNEFDGVTIQALGGDDFISNNGASLIIDGGDGNDRIFNNGVDNSTILGGNGADTIENYSNNSTIIGGAGDDSIFNGGSNVTISVGDGDDTIWNKGSNVTINGGAGNDSIYNNGGSNVLISVGDGSDTIWNKGLHVTINGGNGDNYIYNYSDNAAINGGEGSDTINSEGDYSTILGGAGNDNLSNSGESSFVDGGAGNDSIYNWDNNSTIDAGTGDDYIYNTGNDSTIISGSGDDSIRNSGSNVTVKGGEGNDTIDSGDNSTVNGGEGDDDIYNGGFNSTINGGAGNDYINNSGASSLIDGGTGDDSIYSYGDNVTINTGDGNDTIKNGYEKYFSYKVSNAVIDGGKGDDIIYNYTGTNVLFKYAAGDGNDLITGFDETSTLSVSGATYTRSTVGNNLIITVGNGSITLQGAATLATVNIDGEEIFENTWKLDGTTATYGNLITVSGIKSLDGISLNNKVVTISAAALNKANITVSDGYTLKLSGVSEPATVAAHFDGLTYKSESTTEGYTLTNNQIVYTPEVKATNLFTLTGVKDTSSVTVKDKVVTISAAALNKANITVSNGYTLALGSNVPKTSTSAASWTSKSGTYTYTAAGTSAGYSLASNKISYTAASGGEQFSVTGLKNTSAVTVSGKKVTIGNASLNGKNVTLTGDFTLALGSDVAKPSTSAASWTNKNGTYTYTAAKTSAGYSLSGKTISYTAASGGDKFTLTGLKSSATPLKSNTGIKVDSKGVVTLSSSALDGKAVTLVNDTKDGVNKIAYKLAVDSSVSTKATTTKAAWTKKNSTFTYTAPITSAFYTLKGNTLNYTAKKGGDKFTITGVKDTNAITVSGKKVTVGNASLNGKAVTLNGDFTLALAKGVATSAKKTAGAFSTVSKGTATYTTTSFSGYYKLNGKKISYTAATGGQAITLKNLNTSANLAAVKKGITVAEQKNGSYLITFKNSSVLTTKAPTVSAAKGLKYTVAVADSLKPVTKAAAWNISGTTAIFRSDTTAGYTVNSKNAVVYTAQKNGSPLVELTNLAKGVKASSITTKGKVVTLNASVLGEKTAIKSNSGGYSFSLTGNASGKKFTGTSKVDTLTVAANNANVDAGAGNDVVTVSGLKVTLSGGAGNETITVTGKNNIIYGGAGVDTIVSKNSGNTLVGGSGDDQLWGSTKFADVFVYNKGDGHETIRFFDKNDLLQITGTNAITGTYNSSKKEIYFSVASTDKAITLTDFGKTTIFHVNNDTYQLQNNQLIKK